MLGERIPIPKVESCEGSSKGGPGGASALRIAGLQIPRDAERLDEGLEGGSKQPGDRDEPAGRARAVVA